MRIQILMSFVTISLLVQTTSVMGQTLTEDQEHRIKLGVELIKLGCGTGLSQDKTQVTGGVQGWLSLRKLPGVTAGGQVDYTVGESQGFVASLAREITDNVTRLSIAQLDCMRPYVLRIFTSLYPQEPISEHSPEVTAIKSQVTLPAIDAVAPVPIAPTPIMPATIAPVSSVVGIRHEAMSMAKPVPAMPQPGEAGNASTWDATARGRWQIKTSRAGCDSRYYTWAFNGNVVEYRDQDNQIDQEQILEIGSESMSTRTLVSQHHGKTAETPGTMWSYKFFKDGTIGVASSTGKQFVLVRCAV